jgi:hypothetical protein
MSRKNLDQPLVNAKNLIKFNEQIASKYRAGLSLRYLNTYLEQHVVPSSIKDFYKLNREQQTNSFFETIVKSKTNKDISWLTRS